MKKVALLFVILALAITAVACGKSDSKSSSKTYVIGTDATYAPMEFMDKDKIKGFDIDFLKAVMKEAGLKYEVKNISWDALFTSVKQATEVDGAISSVTINDERKKTYDFSAPYFESTNLIMVKKGSSIKSAADLKNARVALQTATTADSIVSGIKGKTSSQIKRFGSNAEAFLEMDKGGADAVVADNMIINEYVKNNPGKDYVAISDASFPSEYYGLLLPKGSKLTAKLDPAIKTVTKNGEYAKIYKKWFGSKPDLTNLKAQQ
jgi:polar amino acid transport system substrate-binding protein